METKKNPTCIQGPANAAYFISRGMIEAGSVARHRNVRIWKDVESGEWHAEALAPSITEEVWSETSLDAIGAFAFIWRGSNVLFTASPKMSERLTIERVESLGNGGPSNAGF